MKKILLTQKSVRVVGLAFLILFFGFDSPFGCQGAFAQKEANIWCFGQNAGLDFNSGSPVFFPGVAMNQWEGVTSIANANGQLLFYSDGVTAWNRNHVPMPNGSGLLSNSSITQAALIVKQPGANPNYYLFTVDSFYYSIVDTTLQGGLGDITAKNVFVSGTHDERLTACRHANGIDVWIIISSNYGDNIEAYLLTSSGLNMTPVLSNNGLVHGVFVNNQIGYMKTSLAGDKLAMAFNTQQYELYDFDNSTGTATNPMVFDSSAYLYAYGVEFSPDGTRLYGSCRGTGACCFLVFQFDLTLSSVAAIKNSSTLVAVPYLGITGSCLQLAPDGKIYLSHWGNNILGRFDNPNGLGIACSYDDSAIVLPAGIKTNGGLPNFCSGIFYQALPQAEFSALNYICPGTCTNFNNLSVNGSSFEWTFAGANPSVSGDVNPTNICYNTPGTYEVQLVATNPLGSDTLLLPNYITIVPQPQSAFSADTTVFCPQGCVNFTNVSANASTYQWEFPGAIPQTSTDTNPQNICYNSTGSYDVNLICFNGTCSDTLTLSNYINIDTQPQISFTASPISFCPGTCTDFTNSSTNATTYQWDFPGASVDTSTLENPSTICYNISGQYDVTLVSSNGVCSDSLTVTNYITVFAPPSAISIVQLDDTLLTTQGFTSYQWYYNTNTISGATDYFYVATQSGDYNVVATDANGCEVEAAVFNVLVAVSPLSFGEGSGVRLHPNPVEDKLEITGSFLKDKKEIDISIYNLVGEKVFSAVDCRLRTVDCGLLPRGMYYLEVSSSEKTFRTKFVKQ